MENLFMGISCDDDRITLGDLQYFIKFYNINVNKNINTKEVICNEISKIFFEKPILDILHDVIEKEDIETLEFTEFLKLKLNVIKFIFKLGVSVDDIISFDTSRTVFTHAIYNYEYISTETLEFMCDRNPYVLSKDYMGRIPLMYALSRYSPNGPITEQLIYKMFRLFRLQKGDNNIMDKTGSNLLMCAIDGFFNTNLNKNTKDDKGILDIITYILLKLPPKNINLQDDLGYTVFYKAVMFENERLPPYILNFILDLHPNINIADNTNTTALHSFIFNGDFDPMYNEIIQRMLDLNVDPVIIDKENERNVLMGLLSMNFDTNPYLQHLFLQFFQRLEQIDTNLLYSFDNTNQNLLMYVLTNQTLDQIVVNNILYSEQECNIVDKVYRQTPLMIAVLNHVDLAIFEYVLKRTNKRYLNKQDNKGFNALMHLLSSEPLNIEKFKLLVKRDIDYTQKNKDGKNIIEFAKFYKLDNRIILFFEKKIEQQLKNLDKIRN
jgi:ankyrin repeat protein